MRRNDAVLLDVSVRPDSKRDRKIILLHFSDNTFYHLHLKKGDTKVCALGEIKKLVMSLEK